MWDEEYALIAYLELLECGFIVDKCDDHFSIFSYLCLLDEDEVTALDTLLIHRVTISAEEKILLVSRDDLGGYWDLGLDVLVGKYRHTACDRTDEWDIADGSTICLEGRGYAYLIMRISIDPSLVGELLEHDRYGARRCISECCLECTYSEFLTIGDEFLYLLEDELFLVGEFFHNSSGVRKIK